MKPKVKTAACILLLIAIIVTSCKKEKSVPSVVTPPPPGNLIKAKVLEYGTDQPLTGTDIYVCTSPAGLNACAGNYLRLTTDVNGECFFYADSFNYGWVDKAGYWQNFFVPCFVTYFRNDTLLNYSHKADRFIVKVIPKTDFTIHVRDSSGRGLGTAINLVGDVNFHGCVSSQGILGVNLRPGIDTTIRFLGYYGNTTYLLRVGSNYDSDCGCFQTEFYHQTIYFANGNNTILDITY